MKIHAWIENHRTGIADVVNAISFGTWLVSLFFVRTLGGAGVMLMYLFYSATPETTVYQLSQFVHYQGFWVVSFMLAGLYTVMYVAFYGTISGHRPVALGNGIPARAFDASFVTKSTDKQ